MPDGFPNITPLSSPQLKPQKPFGSFPNLSPLTSPVAKENGDSIVKGKSKLKARPSVHAPFPLDEQISDYDDDELALKDDELETRA
jgi:hypothetical protein